MLIFHVHLHTGPHKLLDTGHSLTESTIFLKMRPILLRKPHKRMFYIISVNITGTEQLQPEFRSFKSQSLD